MPMKTPPIDTVQITISGPVGAGKTAVLRSVHDLLINRGFAAVMMDPDERLNPSPGLDEASVWERPKHARTVFLLSEQTEGREQPDTLMDILRAIPGDVDEPWFLREPDCAGCAER
jgi:RecG-like helicase